MTTFGELQTQIKREARVQGTDELDTFVSDVVKEVHDQHTERQRFDELLVPDYDITLAYQEPWVGLPEDFQHLKEVRFSTDGSSFRELDVRGDFHQKRGNYGLPKFYEKVDRSIKLYPYDGIQSTHHVQIDYYKTATLDSTAANMPVNKLVPVVRREVISRVHLFYKENEQASAYKGLASEAVLGIQSRTETGN